MSVDVSAKIVYGFILSHEEFKEYDDRLAEQGIEVSDFCFYANSYDEESDVIFGITVEGTDYIESINKINGYDVELWERCLADWKADFPDRADEEPGYFLVCKWY